MWVLTSRRSRSFDGATGTETRSRSQDSTSARYSLGGGWPSTEVLAIRCSMRTSRNSKTSGGNRTEIDDWGFPRRVWLMSPVYTNPHTNQVYDGFACENVCSGRG